MSGEGEHPLSGKLNLCKSRKANSTPRLAGGKRAAPSQGFDVAPRLRWGLIDAFGKSLAKLSGVTPFGYFFTPCRRQRRRQLHRSGTFAAVVLKSHGCEAVAAERADRMRVNFCAFAQKPKQQKLRGRAEVEQ